MSRVLNNSVNQIIQKYSLTHKGIDLVKEKNKQSEIIAHSDGLVVAISTGKRNDINASGTASYGNYVKIKHNNGMYTLYAHLDKVFVKKNDRVKRGYIIGTMGKSGKAYGVHLHFEVRNSNDVRINPTIYIDNDLPNLTEQIDVIYQVYDNKSNKWLRNVTNDTDYAGNIGNPIGGLYVNLTKGSIKYRVHEINNKWLPLVTNRDDYAGNLKKDIDGLQIMSEDVSIMYRVHLIGNVWLPWVDKFDDTSSGYAGIFGKKIDAIQLKVK